VRVGVLTFEYDVRNFDRAWDAVDRGEPFDVIVRGWRVPILRRSMPLCEVFFGRERRSGPHTPSEILRIGLYGSFSPWLLGINNHGIIAGMTAHWRETEGTITVSFRPRSP
jgi:hypothetical protein